MIKLLNEAGSLRIIKQRGRLNITTHPSALNALEKMAVRYLNRNKSEDDRDEELIKWSLEAKELENNTHNNSHIDCNDASEIQQLLEQKKELLDPIGIVPAGRREKALAEWVFKMWMASSKTEQQLSPRHRQRGS